MTAVSAIGQKLNDYVQQQLPYPCKVCMCAKPVIVRLLDTVRTKIDAQVGNFIHVRLGARSRTPLWPITPLVIFAVSVFTDELW